MPAPRSPGESRRVNHTRHPCPNQCHPSTVLPEGLASEHDYRVALAPGGQERRALLFEPQAAYAVVADKRIAG